jgi:hypothetical protein
MAVTTDPFTATDLAAIIPEIWTPIVNEALFPKAVLSNFVTDLSEYMSEGGDIAHVPDIYTNVFTVRTQSTQGAEITTESVAQVDTTLTVNLHKYVAYIIGDKDMQQLATKYNLNSKYAREIQNLLTQALEDSLFALWSSISTNTVGDTATVLTDLEVRSAIDALDSTNYDLDETAFFIHPTVFWKQLGGITKYYRKNESDLNFIMTGNFGPMDESRGLKGQLYDIPVFTSSRVVGALQTYRNLYLHRSALGFAIQTKGGSGNAEMSSAARIRIQAEHQLRNLGVLVVGDIIYGVAVLREPGAVLLNANTTATTT